MKETIQIKNFKGFNWYGFFTLYTKEVKRFFNVFEQILDTRRAGFEFSEKMPLVIWLKLIKN